MSYESAYNPSTTRLLPGTLAQYRVPSRERLGDYEAVTGKSGFGDYTTTNWTQGNPFRRHGYNPLLARMQGFGEPPADDCPPGAARDPIFQLCLPTGGAGNTACPPGLVFDKSQQICVWPQDLPPGQTPPPCPSGFQMGAGGCVLTPPPVQPCAIGYTMTAAGCTKDPSQPPPPKTCPPGYVMTAQGCLMPTQPIQPVVPVKPQQANMLTVGLIALGAIAIVGVGFAMIHGVTS